MKPKEAGTKVLTGLLAKGLDVVWVSAREPVIAPVLAIDVAIERLWPGRG